MSQNLKNGKLTSLYNALPFIFECFHDEQHIQCAKKHRESTEPESQLYWRIEYLIVYYVHCNNLFWNTYSHPMMKVICWTQCNLWLQPSCAAGPEIMSGFDFTTLMIITTGIYIISVTTHRLRNNYNDIHNKLLT